ncbi:MAG: carbon-nitrogen hydrolase family protein [Pedococcus sp.]
MRIAISQVGASKDVAANLEQIERLAAAAASSGARVVLFPEGAMFECLSTADELCAAAQPLDGPFVAGLRDAAARHSITLIVGLFESRGPGERPYNTVVAVDSAGVVATHRKALLYDAFGYNESDSVEPAPLVADVFDVDGVRFGLITCYEIRFPEVPRALVDAGAQVLLVSSAWPVGPAKEDHWTTMVKARAIENTVYVAAAGDCGTGLVGRSHIVDPLGYVLAGLAGEPGTACVDVTLERLDAARLTLPLLVQRRSTVLA